MNRLSVLEADITSLGVDAIVNAANARMRGGGGVDGAIHAAGGPVILQECVERFPNGLAVGKAGWTSAGDMRAKWVIHTVGPNYAAGQRDPNLLVSCYRESLLLADELGAHSVAFPLISAGIFGWPLESAIDIAVSTLSRTRSTAEEISISVIDFHTRRAVERALTELT